MQKLAGVSLPASPFAMGAGARPSISMSDWHSISLVTLATTIFILASLQRQHCTPATHIRAVDMSIPRDAALGAASTVAQHHSTGCPLCLRF